MEFTEAMNARYSVRDYTDKPVSEEDIRAVVEAGGKAASWCNSQPWRVWAATGETLERIRTQFAEKQAAEEDQVMELDGVHRETLTDLASDNMGHFFEQIMPAAQEGKFIPHTLFAAPCALILTVPKDSSPYCMYDAGAFGQQLMLAAADRGIASIVAAGFVAYSDVVRRELNIPEDETIVVGIGLGYASDDETNNYHADRMPVDSFLTIAR